MHRFGTRKWSARCGANSCVSISVRTRDISILAKRSGFIVRPHGRTVTSGTWVTLIGKAWPIVSTQRLTANSCMKLQRAPAAIVFDMDGLLFDTETLSQEAIILAAAEGGHQVAQEVFNRTVGLPWAQSRALLLSHFGETFPSTSSRR